MSQFSFLNSGPRERSYDDQRLCVLEPTTVCGSGSCQLGLNAMDGSPKPRALSAIRASPKLSSVVIWDSAPDPRRGLHLLSFKFGELTLVH
ncbi:hypothetical protein TNIN_207811 [Trichonephila inaurata madagascariensis]|uniref:Uncharacterized protein n=1 Tax=Trichonephila inaurata madagascariensis TaxID=2747483 RepID=A0A8X6WRC1_9ARAC|nr:hypothetical protein TNIN_207811 [Trichonephila inaurata madagascariensis]